MQDDEQKQENTTQVTQAFFAAPEEFATEKPAVKHESKPVLEKFVKPEQDMAPAGSFLNPYRQKAIDFILLTVLIWLKKNQRSRQLLKRKKKPNLSKKITLPGINSRRYLYLIRRLLPKTITLKKESAISAVFWNRLCLILR